MSAAVMDVCRPCSSNDPWSVSGQGQRRALETEEDLTANVTLFQLVCVFQPLDEWLSLMLTSNAKS